VWCRPCRR